MECSEALADINYVKQIKESSIFYECELKVF